MKVWGTIRILTFIMGFSKGSSSEPRKSPISMENWLTMMVYGLESIIGKYPSMLPERIRTGHEKEVGMIHDDLADFLDRNSHLITNSTLPKVKPTSKIRTKLMKYLGPKILFMNKLPNDYLPIQVNLPSDISGECRDGVDIVYGRVDNPDTDLYILCKGGRGYQYSDVVIKERQKRQAKTIIFPNSTFTHDTGFFPNGAFEKFMTYINSTMCIKRLPTCRVSSTTIKELSDCGILTCTDSDCISNKTDYCKKVATLALMAIAKKGYIQPTTNYFVDNKPRRRLLTIYDVMRPVTPPKRSLEQSILSCDGSDDLDFGSQSCNSIIHGDLNSVYKTFSSVHEIVEGTHAHVLTTQDSFWNCEHNDPIWKGISVLASITGHADAVGYTIGIEGTPGFVKDVDCHLTVCTVCIKEIPFVLNGKCEFTTHITGGNHILKMCNSEPYSIGYTIRPIHSHPRLTTDYNYRSKYLLMNVYSYLHEKWIGINPQLVGDANQDSILKGKIQAHSCSEQILAPDTTNWLYYYAKCGSEILHHNENIDEPTRCRLKYDNSKLGRFASWFCSNWYPLRFVFIVLLTVLSLYLLYLVGLGYYISMFLCILVCPLSYLLFKWWPRSMRCTHCLMPWYPWHECMKVCMCGAEFTPEHTLNCEFYIHDGYIENVETGVNTPVLQPGQPGYLQWYKEYKKNLKNLPIQKTSEPRKVDYLTSKFHIFSRCKNPYTLIAVRFVFFTAIYLFFCSILPTAMATCVRCTQNCYHTDLGYYENCQNKGSSCTCILSTKCKNDTTIIQAKSTDGTFNQREDLITIPSCANLPKTIQPHAVDFYISALLTNDSCMILQHPEEETRREYVFHVASGLSTHAKLLILRNQIPEVCSDFISLLELESDHHQRLDQMSFSPLMSVDGIDISRKLRTDGIEITRFDNKTGRNSVDTSKTFEETVHNHLKPIQQVVQEQVDEETMRKRGELIQEFLHLLNLLKYNGSIFGRDHAINYPSPPPFLQHVYTEIKSDTHLILDMTFPATSGRSMSFRPIHKGKEIPITFTLSVPEVAGVYELLYAYTTCRTRSIDVVRHDKCVGSCSDCFDILGNSVKKNMEKKWQDPANYERLSFDSPNTWGCEGEGCWTVNTGCLCAYCANTPDINDCYDVYRIRYVASRALVCMSINEEHQCEQMNLAQVINRSGKLQLSLEGSDEWVSSMKSELVAIHQKTSEIKMGAMSSLGESTGNFGAPQYSQNYTPIYKEADIESHYVCKSGEDQEVIVNSCFKDTWSMLSTLQKAPAFFKDSDKKLLYHLGSTIGTVRAILELPITKIEWEIVSFKINIMFVQCSGCYKCIDGALCTIKLDSSHTGLVYVQLNPGIVRVSTMNVIRGIHIYNVTADFDSKNMHSTFLILDTDHKVISQRKVSTSLKAGNTPRTSVRNATTQETNLFGVNDNSYGSMLNKIKIYNPISILSRLFSSSLIHWVLYLIVIIVTISIVSLLAYRFLGWAYKKSTAQVLVSKKDT